MTPSLCGLSELLVHSIAALARRENIVLNQTQYLKMKALSAFLLQVLSIASIISAALGFSGTRYVMNRFVLRIPRVLPGSTCYQNSSLSFDLMDMEPLLNETLFTQCMATWDGKLNGYPSDTARVRQEAFRVNIGLIMVGALSR